MSYVNMDHASWVEGQLGYLAATRSRKKSNAGSPPTPTKLSPFQRTVMNILGIIGCGIYNAPIGKLDNIDWDFGGGPCFGCCVGCLACLAKAVEASVEPPEFRDVWDEINAKLGLGWGANPWVWAITFRRVQP